MSNVIDFKTPAQMREMLAAKDEELKALKSELAAVKAVKEMLVLQTLDLKEQLKGHIDQMNVIMNNLDSLLAKID
jgi:hypothetical protein